MHEPEQSKHTSVAADQAEQGEQIQPDTTEKAPTDQPAASEPLAAVRGEAKGFDWFAIGVVLLLAGLFAVAVRLSPQPPASLTPVAVLSATGCGLLVTALRKLHTVQRPGLLEAALGGLGLAVFQFMAAITYPDVFKIISTDGGQRLGFLSTWALVVCFSVIFSMAGAVVGHLAFAPLRPLPTRPESEAESSLDTEEEESTTATEQSEAEESTPLMEKQPDEEAEQAVEDAGDENSDRQPEEQITPVTAPPPTPPRSFFSYLITVLVFGLAPTVTGYVFSAAFDFMLSVNHFISGPFPSLRLLSTLLPWQIPIPIDLSGSRTRFIIYLLWRIPLFFGNPTLFDLQALEPFVFNGAALAILLLTMRNQASSTSGQPPSWRKYLLLEAILGLALVLPADLWIVRGMQGLLQVRDIIAELPALRLLDQRTFLLNLITGPLVCLGIGALLRRQSGK